MSARAAAGVAVALLVGARGARAELLEVRQIAKGMECAECARNLKLEIQKLDRVEAASASWNRRVLTVRFAPGSHATLAEVRAVLRRQHFVPGEAEIVVAGRLGRTDGGALLLDGGPGARFRLDLAGMGPSAEAVRREGDGAREALVTGRVPGENASGGERPADPGDGPGPLYATSVSLKADARHDDSAREIPKGTP